MNLIHLFWGLGILLCYSQEHYLEPSKVNDPCYSVLIKIYKIHCRVSCPFLVLAIKDN